MFTSIRYSKYLTNSIFDCFLPKNFVKLMKDNSYYNHAIIKNELLHFPGWNFGFAKMNNERLELLSSFRSLCFTYSPRYYNFSFFGLNKKKTGTTVFKKLQNRVSQIKLTGIKSSLVTINNNWHCRHYGKSCCTKKKEKTKHYFRG